MKQGATYTRARPVDVVNPFIRRMYPSSTYFRTRCSHTDDLNKYVRSVPQCQIRPSSFCGPRSTFYIQSDILADRLRNRSNELSSVKDFRHVDKQESRRSRRAFAGSAA